GPRGANSHPRAAPCRRAATDPRRTGAAAGRATRALALHALARDAQHELRAADRALAVAQAALAPAAEDRRAVLRLPSGHDRDRQGRAAAPGALVVDRPRQQDPRARGRGPDRGQDRARPGVHDLRLPARLDRPRVHRRRPRDADRLRPRRRRAGSAGPRAGHLQARRARRPQRMDRLRRLDPARHDGRRQLRARHLDGRHEGRARQRRRRGRSGAGAADAQDAALAALGM
ncbi:MAG: hypothetical protein AVDCRST_MAG67-3348, partial [uncultured Solirubrobacteraceae bacterium]